jgi:4-aminobutyrate aminotransferase
MRGLIERDGKVISPSYTRGYPLVIERGQGTTVWDVDGNQYIDFTTGIAVNATGQPAKVVKNRRSSRGNLFMSGTDFYYRLDRTSQRLASVSV